MRANIKRPNQRGFAMTYIAIFMIIGLALASFAVDYGRVQVVKTELRRGADAAARAAVVQLGDYVTAQSQAVTWAGQNTAESSPIVLSTAVGSTDIEFGTWDGNARTFLKRLGLDQANANSVRINARRAAANGTAVKLAFTKMLGISECDVTGTSIACVAPSDFVIVGIDSLTMAGNSTDSYWSNGVTTAAGNSGNIASNGDITCKGTSIIHGNAHPGIGKTVIGASQVKGAISNLTYVLSYPNGDPSPYNLATNDNNLLAKPPYVTSTKAFATGSKSFTVPAGNYVLSSISVGSAGGITLTGPVTLYCYGTVDIKGDIFTYQNKCDNFHLVMIPNPTTGVPPGAINLASSGTMTCRIYAPQSDVIMGSNFDYFGQIIGKNVNTTGGSTIHYDATTAMNGGISTVR